MMGPSDGLSLLSLNPGSNFFQKLCIFQIDFRPCERQLGIQKSLCSAQAQLSKFGFIFLELETSLGSINIYYIIRAKPVKRDLSTRYYFEAYIKKQDVPNSIESCVGQIITLM